MSDLRIDKLANILVEHSCRVQKGDRVLIDIYGSDRSLGLSLISAIYEKGGYPFVQLNDDMIRRSLLFGTSEEHMNTWTGHAIKQMEEMDAYIGVRGSDNVTELSDVPGDKMKLFSSIYSHRVHSELRVKNTKWVVLRYPNSSMAQLANTSTQAFEDFYFNVCNVDYNQMALAMEPLVKRMERASEVHIVGPGTDLKFSIRDIPVVKCAGEFNIPDGEVFTAPVRDSVQGEITFNTPTVYQGSSFENVFLKFKDGKIIKAESTDTRRLNQILDGDEGARYIGEFAIGVNPNINHPMKDILFDEKINGSFHFTPGQAYEEADNGNRSSVHWDMVCIQRTDYGGGEIYFDGELIRKDGLFVVEDLFVLNPENLRENNKA